MLSSALLCLIHPFDRIIILDDADAGSHDPHNSTSYLQFTVLFQLSELVVDCIIESNVSLDNVWKVSVEGNPEQWLIFEAGASKSRCCRSRGASH